ncbi:MAG: hypothetical protein RL701_4842, partial [Pseudomonadota bacterium]
DTGSPEAFQRVGIELQWSPKLRRLALRPALGHPLTPGRRYAALVTRRVTDLDGRSLEPMSTFAAVRDAKVVLTDTRLMQARALYTPVFETLTKLGTPREDVVAIAVFRVQTASSELDSAQRIVRARAAPVPQALQAITGLDKALGAANAVATTGNAAPHEHLQGMIHGTLPTPNFLSATAKSHGVWKRDGAQALELKRVEAVPFTLFVPKGDQPASLVLYQHQRGHDRSDAAFIADALAQHNIAVFAIDGPFQGLRARSESTRGVDTRNRFTGANTPDNFGDEAGDFYGTQDDQGPLVAFHPFYLRDAMRQGVVDLMNVARFLEDGDWSPITELGGLGTRKYDRRRWGFIGEDIGAEMGVMLAPYEPNLGAMALVGASAFVAQGLWLNAGDQTLFSELSNLLGRNDEPSDYAKDLPAFWPELALFETLLGRGEPLAYADGLRRAPVNAWLLMAREDEAVANITTEALGVSLGAELLGVDARYATTDLVTLEANSGDIVTSNFPIEIDHVTRAMSVYEPADHRWLTTESGQHRYEVPVEPPFRQRTELEAFPNPHDAVQAHLVEYFASYFDCVNAGPPTTLGMRCTASVTVP